MANFYLSSYKHVQNLQNIAKVFWIMLLIKLTAPKCFAPTTRVAKHNQQLENSFKVLSRGINTRFALIDFYYSVYGSKK